MGHLEEEILQKTRDLQRAVLEEAAERNVQARRGAMGLTNCCVHRGSSLHRLRIPAFTI